MGLAEKMLTFGEVGFEIHFLPVDFVYPRSMTHAFLTNAELLLSSEEDMSVFMLYRGLSLGTDMIKHEEDMSVFMLYHVSSE